MVVALLFYAFLATVTAAAGMSLVRSDFVGAAIEGVVGFAAFVAGHVSLDRASIYGLRSAAIGLIVAGLLAFATLAAAAILR